MIAVLLVAAVVTQVVGITALRASAGLRRPGWAVLTFAGLGASVVLIARAVDQGLSLAEIRGRYPHEMSGGQLQRAAIARALIPNPALLIADEPVSMVDASLRMAIVNLLKQLRDEFGVSVIYITHDLATAYYISDRLMIMQKGRVVEMGPARPILDAPEHPYSKLLKGAVLSVDAFELDQSSQPPVQPLSGVPPGVLVESTSGRLVRRQVGPHAS